MGQFFWEGLLLTAVSGAIGIAASAGLMATLQALLTGKMPGWDPPRLVPWSAALAMGTLVLSGIAAGLYPASKAAADGSGRGVEERLRSSAASDVSRASAC